MLFGNYISKGKKPNKTTHTHTHTHFSVGKSEKTEREDTIKRPILLGMKEAESEDMEKKMYSRKSV